MLLPFESLVDFQLRREYIGQNLCENLDLGITQCKGACYLEKKIKDDRQNPDASTRFTKQNQKFSSPFLKTFFHPFSELIFPVKTSCLGDDNHYRFQFIAYIFHPPELEYDFGHTYA